MECGELQFVLFLKPSQRGESGLMAAGSGSRKGIDLDQATLKE
jgi:hypothetical protein